MNARTLAAYRDFDDEDQFFALYEDQGLDNKGAGTEYVPTFVELLESFAFSVAVLLEKGDLKLSFEVPLHDKDSGRTLGSEHQAEVRAVFDGITTYYLMKKDVR